MAKTERQALQLRAQEIINAAPDGIAVREALAQAALEIVGHDAVAMAHLFASAAESTMRAAKKANYELPEDLTLFPVPDMMYVRLPEGDFVIRRDHATLGQVRQWVREGRRVHAVQRLRFDRFQEMLDDGLKNEPDELPWWAAKAMVCQSEEPSDA